MKKRDIGILAGLGLVVLLVAWYFLIIGPKRDEISETEQQVQKEKNAFEENSSRVKRIDEERNAAKQTSAELLKLNKLVPVDSQVPSMIVELQQSAGEAGIQFMKIEPQDVVSGTDGNTIVTFELKFQGNFFDVNDFLYRVENYARMEGNDINVSGRLISVVSIVLEEPKIEPKFPQIMATLGVNAYMTTPPPAKTPSKEGGGGTSGNSEASGSSAAGG